MNKNYISERFSGQGRPRKSFAACSDAELVLMVRNRGLGWKIAFSTLLGRHREWLVKHCIFRLSNWHDAQDVVQQVMLRAWQAIDRFEGRSAFRTWLYAIAENQCRSFSATRLRYVQTEHIERLIDLHLQEGSTSDVECYARSQAVAAAMEGVNVKAREVLLLRFFQDYSLEMIANTLTISLSATKMRLYRALAQFEAEYLRVVGAQAIAV